MPVIFMPVTLIVYNATSLKGSPVPHFFITDFKNLRASFLRYMYSFIAGQIPGDEEQLQWCFGAHQSGVYKYRRPISSVVR